MPDTPSITINKRIPYRGGKEVYSNTYHFTGTQPSTFAEWKTLAEAIWTEERKFMTLSQEYVGFLGYEAGNNFAVAIEDKVADGTAIPTGGINSTGMPNPGDAAVWVRWRLPTRNSRGKWNYLRKYFHGVGAGADDVGSTAANALNAYALKMKDGTLPGGAKISGEQGAAAGAHKVAPYVSFRQLKRTGKRPSR